MKINFKTIGAAIPRNVKLAVVLILCFASYQHGKFVGQLGGHYDSAAYEALIANVASGADKQRIYAADEYIDANPPKMGVYHGR